jgi:hypothetical protein
MIAVIASTPAATAHGSTPRRGTGGSGISSSSNRALLIWLNRWRGSLTRHSCNSRRTLAGTASRSGSFVSTAASVSDTVALSNNRRPVSISYSTTPKAQMSARRSTFCPRACSGAM